MHALVHQHILLMKKYILVLGEGLAQGLDDTAITAEAKFSINFTQSKIMFCLSIHGNESNSYSCQ